MADRYITKSGIERSLAAGEAVEQWLGTGQEGGRTTIRWMRIDRHRTGRFSVSTFEVYDDGNENFIDIYEFSSTDPDADGNPTLFDDVEGALAFAAKNLHADIGRFVGAGLIQEEYADYRRASV